MFILNVYNIYSIRQIQSKICCQEREILYIFFGNRTFDVFEAFEAF